MRNITVVLVCLILTAPSLVFSVDNKIYSVDDFRMFWEKAKPSVPEIVKSFGPPDKEVGSGIYILKYHLGDGSSVLIGTSDMKVVRYIFHLKVDGTREILFSQSTK